MRAFAVVHAAQILETHTVAVKLLFLWKWTIKVTKIKYNVFIKVSNK